MRRKVSGPEMFRIQGNLTRNVKGYFPNRHMPVRILHAQPASAVSAVRFSGVEEPPTFPRVRLARRVSGRQVPDFRPGIGAFEAPVSARHFSISVSAGRRPVRHMTETGSSGIARRAGCLMRVPQRRVCGRCAALLVKVAPMLDPGLLGRGTSKQLRPILSRLSPRRFALLKVILRYLQEGRLAQEANMARVKTLRLSRR